MKKAAMLEAEGRRERKVKRDKEGSYAEGSYAEGRRQKKVQGIKFFDH
ncbi:MAG: hypothetical protein F6K17_31765 [Okeania sp. SIO3C4]|nr:hypothetical protein [Okeania sp. SIO3C4]